MTKPFCMHSVLCDSSMQYKQHTQIQWFSSIYATKLHRRRRMIDSAGASGKRQRKKAVRKNEIKQNSTSVALYALWIFRTDCNEFFRFIHELHGAFIYPRHHNFSPFNMLVIVVVIAWILRCKNIFPFSIWHFLNQFFCSDSLCSSYK